MSEPKKHVLEPDKWVEGKDNVTAENRGSSLIERYLDPNDNEIDLGGSGGGVGGGDFQHSWDSYYQFRMIRRERFVP